MMNLRPIGPSIALVLAALVPDPSHAQGRERFMNFESPQVRPIRTAIFRQQDGAIEVQRRFLFVCNTPNDSVEVFDLGSVTPGPGGAPDPVKVAEIPVGQRPVSVLPRHFDTVWGIPQNAIFSADFLGDSVTWIACSFEVDASDAVTFSTRLMGTLDVGDSPVDLAFANVTGSDPRLYVSKRFRSSFAVLDVDPVSFSVLHEDVELVVDGPGDGSSALKEPHSVLIHPNRNELWVLGHQGGSGDPTVALVPNTSATTLLEAYDLDLCVVDISDPDTATPQIKGIGGLGTTNFNMTFTGDGNRLYVVGTDALANQLEGDQVSMADTGFVRTKLYHVDSSTPLAGMAELGVASSDGCPPMPGEPTVVGWDVNRNNNGLPVAPANSLAHLTDVQTLITIPIGGGQSMDVMVASAFNSDNFALIAVNTVPCSGTLQRPLFIGRTRLFTGAPPREQLRGPRGLALDRGSYNVYLLGRLSNELLRMRLLPTSVYAFQEAPGGSPTDDVYDLAPSREPQYIRDGRRFLYSTRYSGNGFVNCASCHIDGRSGQQAWLLKAETGLVFPYDDEVGMNNFLDDDERGIFFPDGKPHFVTQSLQGLTNFEMNVTRMPAPATIWPPGFVEPNGLSPTLDLVTNAPYHWRGDKPGIAQFNEAFVGLQGMQTGPVIPGEPLPAFQAAGANAGLTNAEMAAFEEFLFSIHYPPNPRQPASREYEGVLGPLTEDGLDMATGALGGLRHYLENVEDFGGFGGRTCEQCHSLPVGSNNRVNDPAPNLLPNTLGFLGPQPFEPSGFRGMRQKEGLLEDDDQQDICVPSTTRSGDLGTSRQGMRVQPDGSILALSFRGFVEQGCGDQREAPLTEINKFIKQFDHGVAPIVGRSFTVRGSIGGPVQVGGTASAQQLLDDWVREADDGNADIVAMISTASTSDGAVYDVVSRTFKSATTDLDVLPGGGNPWILGQVVGYFDRLVVAAVPLGSGHEVAGLARPQLGAGTVPPPGQIGTSPNEAYELVPTFPMHNLDSLALSPFASVHRTQIMMMLALQGFGVPATPQDPSRRLQFSAPPGEPFPPGTVIELFLHHEQPDTSGPPAIPANSTRIELPIFPTRKGGEEDLVWETAIELDPHVLYSLLLGGPFAPGVAPTWGDPISIHPLLFGPAQLAAYSPGTWNQYTWRAMYRDQAGDHFSSLQRGPLLY